MLVMDVVKVVWMEHFILFVYEFDCAEKLHSCSYANSSSRRSIKQQEN